MAYLRHEACFLLRDHTVYVINPPLLKQQRRIFGYYLILKMRGGEESILLLNTELYKVGEYGIIALK